MANRAEYNIKMAGVKQGHDKKQYTLYKVSVSEKEMQRLSLEALKEQRDLLRSAVKMTKHTVKLKQATKKLKLVDYAIGRMVFFKEDFKTAINKAKAAQKEGNI